MDDRLARRARGRAGRRGRRRCRGRRAAPRSRSARRPGRAGGGRAPRRGCGCRPEQPARLATPGFFSTISCAIRTSVRRRSSRSRTTRSGWLFHARPFLASLDRVKGTDAASLAAARRRGPRSAAARAPLRTTLPVMILGVKAEVAQVIDIHSAAGRRFEAGGVRSFVREQGAGPNVVLLHGVPASSFLYRKVIPRLADQGLRAIALDFPGLGLADRPEQLRLLVVGARALARRGDRRARARPLPPRRPRHRRADRLRVGDPQPRAGALADRAQHDARPGDASAARGRCGRSRSAASASSGCARRRAPLFAALFRPRGSADRSAMSTAEIYAYRALLIRGSTAAAPSCGSCAASSSPRKSSGCSGEGLAERPVAGADRLGRARPGARPRSAGRVVQRVLGVDEPVLLPAKHFLQEDQAAALAYAIADQVAPLG